MRQGLALRDRYVAGEVSPHGLAIARSRLQRTLEDAVLPAKANAENERLANDGPKAATANAGHGLLAARSAPGWRVAHLADREELRARPRPAPAMQ